MPRIDGRRNDEIRTVRLRRAYLRAAPGSVLIETGDTRVVCTATIEEKVPAWRQGSGLGWVTAEYEMLPASTGERRPRNRGNRLDGRTQEIQRLIGRSLRAVVDLAKLGERTIWIDCDVLQADGGTRTAGITGAYVALADAVTVLRRRGLVREDPINDTVAAVSVGLVNGRVLLDLCYEEDKTADVDFTVVATGRGRFVEVQGTGEAGTFSRAQMSRMLSTADQGLRAMRAIQLKALKLKTRMKSEV